MTMQQIGRIIRRTRKAMDLSQAELASVAGVAVRTLSEMENGKESAHIGLVLKVLDSLGIEMR
ncbi:MAG: helix-turn-helix domain-containing protein, partial [Pseudohongiellaceae bacterium]